MLLGLHSPVSGQVQFDAATHETPFPLGGLTCQMSLTIGSNLNRVLIVGVHTGGPSVSTVTGAGATWASTAAVVRSSPSNRVEIWVGRNPNPGSQTVTVTLSATDANILCGVDSFYGVDQTAPTSDAIGNNGSGGNAELTVTSALNDKTFALISHNGFFGDPTGCPTGTDWSTNPNTQTGQGTHCAGAATTTFTWSTTSNWSMAGLNVHAASGGGGGAALWADILSPSRAINWNATNPGVEGGIPHRTEICATLDAAASASLINDTIALAACNGKVVFLQAGTYNLSSGIDFAAHSNVTLRGAGPDQTFLKFTGGTSCGGLGADICFRNEPLNNTDNPGNVAGWNGSGSFPAGTTSITLDSTAFLQPGSLLILDQNDDGVDNNEIFICQTSPACATESPGPGGTGRAGRVQEQIVRVTAVNGNTVTFTPGLYMPNWRSSQAPGAWWSSSLPISMSGIENLSVDHTNSTSVQSGIYFYNAHNSWIRNIRSLNAKRNHVWLYQSAHVTVRDSYFYGTQSAASQSYGIETYMNSDSRVENNIFQHVTNGMMTGGSTSGTVFGYNYSIDDYYNVAAWMQASSYFHAGGINFVLFEGNDGIGFTADAIHGTAHFGTAFRNLFVGWETGKSQQTVPIHIYARNRYMNVVGNVLGRAGYHNNYEAAAPSGTNGNTSIYTLGWSGNEGMTDPAVSDDTRVKMTLLRWGNWDPVTSDEDNMNDQTGTRWCGTAANTNWAKCTGAPASEVPSGIGNYSNFIPATETLPASFYLPAKPSWFGTVSWPAIGPEVTSGTVANVGGHVKKIPARVCFEDATKMPNDPAYPSSSPRIKSFNANSCYPVP
jgi:hypothetical protein